jgi:hypothetical protein
MPWGWPCVSRLPSIFFFLLSVLVFVRLITFAFLCLFSFSSEEGRFGFGVDGFDREAEVVDVCWIDGEVVGMVHAVGLAVRLASSLDFFFPFVRPCLCEGRFGFGVDGFDREAEVVDVCWIDGERVAVSRATYSEDTSADNEGYDTSSSLSDAPSDEDGPIRRA